jgi:hypothetical protein
MRVNRMHENGWTAYCIDHSPGITILWESIEGRPDLAHLAARVNCPTFFGQVVSGWRIARLAWERPPHRYAELELMWNGLSVSGAGWSVSRHQI